MNTNEVAKALKEEAIDEKFKASNPRNPRWTRQETFVLIQGKNVVENQGKRRRKCATKDGSTRILPKWDSVSLYCKRHGVNREPVQCRKRLSNLLTDFKKIKIWDSVTKEGKESYWTMRSDLRRERKLPGFFDRGVYDVLDGRDLNIIASPLAMVAVMEDVEEEDGVEEKREAFFDSSRDAEPEDGIFSDFEQPEKEESSFARSFSPLPFSDRAKEEQRRSMHKEEWKRRRLSFEGCEETNMVDRLIEVLKRNGKMMNTQFEAQNQMNRDQHKDSTNSLVSALDKIADAIISIADKLTKDD